jgi:hypothetical protein
MVSLVCKRLASHSLQMPEGDAVAAPQLHLRWSRKPFAVLERWAGFAKVRLNRMISPSKRIHL